ncbi:DEAD/DEAH box helicase [Flavihumibacter solisilvae]|uniref:Helicase n=1 Tax=Flavihumibacter solisilvae TaxID=1349421 RepID=A0A0C1L8N7_9BACT|nr:DEAD/DEAH box helicase [Flavihumibacter solisilvae]KIC96517.1 helicase [Flavihumibacter solisilvae]
MRKTSTSTQDILAALKIESLNEMQQAAQKAATEHDEVILLSATGTGKTLAYLLPLVNELKPVDHVTQALVIAPTRELALQIEQVFKSMKTGFKVTCCYGGHLRETEENNLMQAPALIIGTPGRLADHIRRENIKTGEIKMLVLDEFDKSLEFGFEEEMAFVTGSLPGLQKKILVSATPAIEIPPFLKMRKPVSINFLTDEKTDALTIQMARSDNQDKLESLFRLICQLGNRPTIVFCNFRESVERTSTYLKEKGIVNVFYHGALEQDERDAALCKFRNGTSNVLVTTDLASRGLDIKHIRYIVHYHLPATEEVFTHRNGRTARMEASGTAILLVGPDEDVPDFIEGEVEEIKIAEDAVLPEKPKWSTLHISAGKKNKINKVDIVGFLSQKGELKKEDIGLIEVKDFHSFVAVRKSKMSHTLHLIKNHRIKNQKVKIDIAR